MRERSLKTTLAAVYVVISLPLSLEQNGWWDPKYGDLCWDSSTCQDDWQLRPYGRFYPMRELMGVNI